MVCRDNPNKPASGEEVQKGCFGAAGLDREVGEGALQPLDKMKFVEHGGKALLIIRPHGSACEGGWQGQYYPAVVEKIAGEKRWRVVEWKDKPWRADNTISANQANNIKKGQEKAARTNGPCRRQRRQQPSDP